MRIGVVADCHIGNHQLFRGRTEAGINERCKAALRALKTMYLLAAVKNVDRVYIAGDLFDTSSPSPQIVAAVMDIIAEADEGPGRCRIETVILKGNHDSNSPNPGDHALGPLAHVALVVEGVTTLGNTLLLPFQPKPTEWLRDAFESIRPSQGTVVISHFGISDAETPSYMQHGGVSENLLDSLAGEYRLGAWLSGDWHAHKRFYLPSAPYCQTYQIGALVPTGFDNPGGDELYGSLLVLDPSDPAGTMTRVVVGGPRFFYSPDEPGMSRLTYLKLRIDQAHREEECAEAVAAGTLGGYVLAPDTETAAPATGAQVADEFAAAEVSNVDEALDVYVDKMPGLDPATRTEVKDLCRKYLHAGK